jgi:hypothetical protein
MCGTDAKVLSGNRFVGFSAQTEWQFPKLDVAGSNPVARFDLGQVGFPVAPTVAHE